MRRRTAEIQVNHERWLVSYADFITLLFAFFVVMYSISQVNESKYRVLSATLTEIFNEPKRTMEPIQIGELSRSNEPQISQSDLENLESSGQGAFEKTADLPQLSDQFEDQFSDLIDDKVVQVNSNEYWLQISLNNSVLFPLGSVEPTEEAEVVISEVAEILRDFNNPIQVEGYTDNVAVSSEKFPSNWELSSARAAAVVKLLVYFGLSPQRLAAVGYGEYHPIAENETPEGRSQNRRVVIMIAREKTKRPRVSTEGAVKASVAPDTGEQVQVNPQPGLEQQSTASPAEKEVSPREKMDQLIDSNPRLGIESVLEINENNKDSSGNLIGDLGGNEETESAITPVETERGGLLFSSDPELPRKDN
jgi:chemotaxis protein MotB